MSNDQTLISIVDLSIGLDNSIVPSYSFCSSYVYRYSNRIIICIYFSLFLLLRSVLKAERWIDIHCLKCCFKYEIRLLLILIIIKINFILIIILMLILIVTTIYYKLMVYCRWYSLKSTVKTVILYRWHLLSYLSVLASTDTQHNPSFKCFFNLFLPF